MLNASLYILACTLKNRVRVRVRRLREPRYLFGAIAGIAYLYLTVFMRMPGGRRRRLADDEPASPVVFQTLQGVGAGISGVCVFALAAVAWILPANSRVLDFTRAETAFLFPAPVSRRQLILHRLIRSQLAVLFGSVILALVVPSGQGSARIRAAVTMWIFLTSVRVYFTGVTLARARLTSPSQAARLVAWPPMVVLVIVAAVLADAFVRQFGNQLPAGVADFAVRVGRATATGWSSVVLWPFTAGLRPLFAQWPGPYLESLAGSILVLAALVVWMLASDEAFENVATEAVERQGAAPSPRRAVPRTRAFGWPLGPSGRAEGVFFWKNAMRTLSDTDARALRWLVPFMVAVIGLGAAVTSANRFRGVASLACVVSLVVAGFTVLFGPQMLRADLRDDLENLDVLKTWPVASAATIRGEMLWPIAFITCASWVAIVCAAAFGGAAFPDISFGVRLAVAVSAIIAAPAVVAAQYTVHNAVAVLLPAWVPQGDQRARGVEAMGQRLILLAGVVVSLVVIVLPGALAGAVAWFVLGGILGAAALVPAALILVAVVFVEVLVITEALAPAYDRLDMLSVERAE